MITSLTKMVLVNAVYFKAGWNHGFKMLKQVMNVPFITMPLVSQIIIVDVYLINFCIT